LKSTIRNWNDGLTEPEAGTANTTRDPPTPKWRIPCGKQQEFRGPHDDHGTDRPSLEVASNHVGGISLKNMRADMIIHEREGPFVSTAITRSAGFVVQIQDSSGAVTPAQVGTL
jgi:hypothetical protein